MSFLRLKPPWLNRSLQAKLARKRRIKAKGLAPVPATKAEQRALLASLTDNRTHEAEDAQNAGARSLPHPGPAQAASEA